jgi:hypothetical protein
VSPSGLREREAPGEVGILILPVQLTQTNDQKHEDGDAREAHIYIRAWRLTERTIRLDNKVASEKLTLD